MSLNEVENDLHRYINEIEAIQIKLSFVQNQLIGFFEENCRGNDVELINRINIIFDEMSDIEQNLSHQLLIDLKDASSHRLTLLRRYLYES